jgi:hypothetical protein
VNEETVGAETEFSRVGHFLLNLVRGVGGGERGATGQHCQHFKYMNNRENKEQKITT